MCVDRDTIDIIVHFHCTRTLFVVVAVVCTCTPCVCDGVGDMFIMQILSAQTTCDFVTQFDHVMVLTSIGGLLDASNPQC